MSVHALWSESFNIEPPVVRQMLAGASLADMRDRMRDVLPPTFDDDGVIAIDGIPVDRTLWPYIKPKPQDDRPVQIRFHMPVAGGGDEGGGKNILATLGAIALTIATGGIAGGALQGTAFARLLGVSFAPYAASSYIAAGLVSVIGSNLISGLVGAPTTDRDSDGTENQRVASASNNVLQFGASVPRVYGERRFFPPLVAQPLVTVEGQDEIVEAVMALSGPHRLRDIRIGSASAVDMPNVQIETWEGFPGKPELRLLRRFGRTLAPNTELKGHSVSDTDHQTLSDTVDVSLAVPQRATYTTSVINGLSPDEFHMHLMFPQGVGRMADPDVEVRIPFRIRLRPSGGDWVNLPEFYFRSSDPRPTKASVVFKWQSNTVPLEMARKAGWVEARRSAPGQNVTPETDGWSSDNYFWAGSGDTIINANLLGSTGIRNIASRDTDLTIRLDPAEFEPGLYEIDIIRGCAVNETDWDTSAYTVDGSLRDLFWYAGTVPKAPYSRDGIADSVAVARNVTIYNDNPVQTSNVAIVSVKARNVQLDQISVLAGGYVLDLDGAVTFDGVAGLSKSDGDTVTGAELDRTVSVHAIANVTFDDSAPTGIIWEQGGSTIGSYLGVTSGELVWRAGDGAVLPNTACASIRVDASSLAGKTCQIVAEVLYPDDTVRLRVYEGATKLVDEIGVASAGLPSTWAGAADGEIGGPSFPTDIPVGESSDNWNGTIASVDFWQGLSDDTLQTDFEWSNWTVTSNPAPHLRDIAISALDMQLYDDTMLDNDDFVEWRQHCVNQGYVVDAVMVGTSFREASRIVAGCGYAQMRVSEKMGVVYDRDRTAESPVQMVTPRNSAGFAVSLPFRKLPDGLRVRFDDAANDYAERTILVTRDGLVRDVGRYEEVRLEGVTTEAAAIARARYELRVYEKRSATYGWDMPIEAMAIRRGSLVTHVADDLSEYHGYGIVTAGGTDSVVIDTQVRLVNEVRPRSVSVPFRTVGRIRDLGLQTAAQIRRLNGDVETVMLDGSTGNTDTLTFAGAVDRVPEGALITVGPHATVSRRLVVTDVTWRDMDTASITAVREAPEIWT